MASYAFDQRWLFEPGLVSPDLKPIGPVKINWSDEITDNLTGCFLFRQNEILKNQVDFMPDIAVISGPNLTSIGNDAFIDDTDNYTLGLDNDLINNATSFGAEDHTIFIKIDVRKSPTSFNDQYLVINQPGSGVNDAAMYLNNTGSTGRLASYGTSLLEVTTREPNFTPWMKDTVSRTYRASNSEENLYVGGGTLAGGGQNGATGRSYPDAFLNDYMYIFPDLANISRRLLAYIECMYFFNRTLSDVEIAILHQDTYRFLYPA